MRVTEETAGLDPFDSVIIDMSVKNELIFHHLIFFHVSSSFTCNSFLSARKLKPASSEDRSAFRADWSTIFSSGRVAMRGPPVGVHYFESPPIGQRCPLNVVSPVGSTARTSSIIEYFKSLIA
jgi:hypothetical protein